MSLYKSLKKIFLLNEILIPFLQTTRNPDGSIWVQGKDKVEEITQTEQKYKEKSWEKYKCCRDRYSTYF